MPTEVTINRATRASLFMTTIGVGAHASITPSANTKVVVTGEVAAGLGGNAFSKSDVGGRLVWRPQIFAGRLGSPSGLIGCA
jgi:hypothetical protein